jgi:hypothetical protein
MDKMKFPKLSDGSPLMEKREWEYLKHKEIIINPDIVSKIDKINEENVYEIAKEIIGDEEIRILIKLEVLRRILNCEPVTFSDVRAHNEKNPSLSTISDLAGNNIGNFKLQDIVYQKGTIFLKTTNAKNEATHFTSVPKNILIDILKVALENKPTEIFIKVPVSNEQQQILDRIKERFDITKKK